MDKREIEQAILDFLAAKKISMSAHLIWELINLPNVRYEEFFEALCSLVTRGSVNTEVYFSINSDLR